MTIVWLKGDYIGKHERQKQAEREGCDLVVSFHFNSSSNPKANGAEVWHNGKGEAEVFAHRLLDAIARTLGVRKRGVKKAGAKARAAFINFYRCPVVLLEPCFVTNIDEANLLHDKTALRALGEEIAEEIIKWAFKANHLRWVPFEKVVVGLDIGHKFKTSSPNDRGARCVFGDYEATHAGQLAKVVAASVQLQAQERW